MSTRPEVVAPVALSALAELVGAARPSVDVAVTGVSVRSGSVRPGDLYAALPGARAHGADFVTAARTAGAVAVLTDEAGRAAATASGLPTVVTGSPRAVLGEVSATVYGCPASELVLVGVTGTQGKTTTTQLLHGALAAAGRRTAVIGTLGTWIAGEQLDTALTTPEASDLHALFAVMRERGVEVCAMEVSSHALVLHRVDGVVFDVAAFVNFGRDHLDFHGDVEHYFAAKASLLTPQRAKLALLNLDDPAVARLRSRLEVPVRTFSATGADADWRCADVDLGADGAQFTVLGPAGVRTRVTSRLVGDFNVANALAALAAAGEAGFDVPSAAVGLGQVTSVGGRLERVEAGQDFAVVVDYAHKPDAVAAALGAMRAVTPGRLWVVLGAGGDRDAGKRELMGEAAGRLADVVVVTDDNPRTEEPAGIRRALIAGVRRGVATTGVPAREVYEVAGRRAAIERAIAGARGGDTVLIAGKGHESGQEVGDVRTPFDDRVVAREVLARLADAAPSS
ncbi:MAG: UDP-N-acetylmuramoyl-L-alanyl-D-glutamate--2,6-diaminopimelate ligase [Nocardioidaceae bacterium]